MSDVVISPLGAIVRDYVLRVRAALSDLPPGDVDDLIGGLEADLVERASELPAGADLTSAFGAPDMYAAELRAAADLPPRSLDSFVAPRPSVVRMTELALRDRRDALLARWPWLQDLRPVWWVLRGIVLAGAMVTMALGAGHPLLWPTALLGGAASFAVSRGREHAVASWSNRLVLLGNVLAPLVALPVAASLLAPRVQYVETFGPPAYDVPRDGAFVNGELATNLYAYDAAGNRIDRVRLFNQYGQAVAVAHGAFHHVASPFVPPTNLDGSLNINRVVFPLRWGTMTGWEASSGGWEPPVKISALTGPGPRTGSPSADASAAPTDPSPSPSVSATP